MSRAARTTAATGNVPAALFTPAAIVHLEVVAFALLTLLGGQAVRLGVVGGLPVPAGATLLEAEAAAATGGASAARAQKVRGGKVRGGKVTSAKVKMLKGGWDAGGVGDTSRSWRWPGTTRLDAAVLALPVRAAPLSPLLARVLVDSSYLRAIFGSLSVLLPASGLLLGALALRDTGGVALPPAAVLLAALTVLGVLDALAGFLAVTVFVIGVAASGALDSATALRTVLGLGVVWFAVPLIAGAARPLRRLAGRGIADQRRRLADLVIASLIGAWAIQKMILALPGLAGRPLPITRYATTIALVVLAVAVIRVGLESIAARFYPGRLAAVQPAAVPRSSSAQRIAAASVRTAVFLFVAVAFIGAHWQLWIGGLLFLVPQLLSIYEHRFTNSERLYRWLPKGLLKLVLMLFVGTAFGAFALHVLAHSRHAALDAFVLLTVPGLVLSALELFGREGKDPDEGWVRWLGGAGVLAIGVLFVLGKLS